MTLPPRFVELSGVALPACARLPPGGGFFLDSLLSVPQQTHRYGQTPVRIYFKDFIMLNKPIIAAARKQQYTLDVAGQIAGIPPRLIITVVAPSREIDGVDLYKLSDIVAAFSSESGERLLRKLHQNQLHLYANCRVTWRDDLGVVHTVEDAYVEIRGKRAEVTLRNGRRTIHSLADSSFRFEG